MRGLAAALLAAVLMLVPATAVGAPSVASLKRQLAAEKAKSKRLQRALEREKAAVFAARFDLRGARQTIADRNATIRARDASVTSLTGERDTALGQVAELTGRVSRLEGEKASLAGQLVSAQTGVEGAIATMTVSQAWGLLDDVYRRFPTTGYTWSASFYQSGSYRSYSFTYSP